VSEFDERYRQSVLHDLESADAEVRRLAVERAAAMTADAAVPILIDRLGDDSWRVRKAAVERLSSLPETTRAIEALIDCLGDGSNSGRRNSAVEALIRMGSLAVPRLEQETRSDDVDVRKLAVDTLAGIGHPEAEGALLARLEDSDTNVRAAAAEALGSLEGGDSRRALLRVVTDGGQESLVRFSALHALAAREHPIEARELGSALDDPILRPAALPLLGCPEDGAAVVILLKGLASDSHQTREGAVRALVRLLSHVDGEQQARLVEQIRDVAEASPSVVAAAVEKLEAAELATRLVWVQFLGLLGREDTVVPILRAGRDEALAEVVLTSLAALGTRAEQALDRVWDELDPRSRHDACVLLGKTSGELGGERLLCALEDVELEVRVAAANAVAVRRQVDALPILVRRLSCAAAGEDFESEEEVHALGSAIVDIAGVGAEIVDGAVRMLQTQLGGAAESVRLAIATVLGSIGRPEDVELVTQLLADPAARVRREAVNALVRLDPTTATDSIRIALGDECPDVRVAAARALGASSCDTVSEDLRCLALDGDPRVRAAAARSAGVRLASGRAGESAGPLARLLDAALTDEATVALAAVQALSEVGGPEALRVASALQRDEPELVYEAVRCLAAHGDSGALDDLIPLVAHPDWTVRAEAIHALADRAVVRAVPPILRRLETEQDEFVRGEMIRALHRLEA
jgi:HEAT repeat protein